MEVFQDQSALTAQGQARRRLIFLEEQLAKAESALTIAQLALTNFQSREGVSGSQEKLAARLRERGWEVEVETDPEVVGGIAAVEIVPDAGLRGIADRRCTNAAAGY